MALYKRNEKGSPLTHIEVDSNWTTIENWLAGKSPLNHTHSIANVIGLQAALDARVLTSQKAVANGVATLGSDGKVPSSQLPNIASNGMYFPHDTLTTDDIGKLVIWKDGKAQLPVFEEAQDASPAIIQYQLNLESNTDFNPDVLTITFSSNPVDEDSITINGNTIRFMDSPILPTDVQIGIDIDATISNFMSNIEILNSSYSYNSPSAGVLNIMRKSTGLYAPFSFKEDLFEASVTSSFATFSNSFTSVANRLGTAAVPFLFLWGLGLFEEAKNIAFGNFYQGNSSFSEVLIEGTFGISNFPNSLSELKVGISDFLENTEGIVSAVWLDDILRVSTFIDLPLELAIDSGDDSIGHDAFENGTITEEYLPPTPAFCKYPILGLVKGVAPTEVEIATEPICEFKSVHDGVVSWDGLFDFGRIFILNPDQPGNLMSILPFGEMGYGINVLLMVTSPGYVAALDNNIESNVVFKGAFSLDLFTIQMFSLLFSGGGD